MVSQVLERSYPRQLQLAQLPTPLQFMPRITEQFSKPYGGPNIWIKRDDMTGSAVSGNKIRKLEFTLAKAIDEECDTIITAGGVQSNHCRTTAILCAQLGLKCHLILRGEAEHPDGNLLLDTLVGAEISYYSNREYCVREQEIFAELQASYAEQGKKAYVIPIGASDGVGLWGYIAASEELNKNFIESRIHPEHIVCATGSGGTHAGLILGTELYDMDCQVWGVNVCDNAAYFKAKNQQDFEHWQSLYMPDFPIEILESNIIEGYVGAGYAQCSDEVFQCIAETARLEGVILDPVYTGKAFYGLLQEIKKGRFAGTNDLVFIHTGGLFGLYAQKDALLAAI